MKIKKSDLTAIVREVLTEEGMILTEATGRKVTVGQWLTVLNHYCTQWSQKRGGNIALYFEASDKLGKKVKPFLKKDDEKAMDALLKNVGDFFDEDFPPVKKWMKHITNYKKTGKTPTNLIKM